MAVNVDNRKHTFVVRLPKAIWNKINIYPECGNFPICQNGSWYNELQQLYFDVNRDVNRVYLDVLNLFPHDNLSNRNHRALFSYNGKLSKFCLGMLVLRILIIYRSMYGIFLVLLRN